MATAMKCDSQVFKDWSAKVDNILSQLPKTDMSGEPLEYPINEEIANKLIQDQQRGADERPHI